MRAINSALPLDRRIAIGEPIAVDDWSTFDEALDELDETLDELPAGTLIVHTGIRDRFGRVKPRGYYRGERFDWSDRDNTVPVKVGYVFINADPNYYVFRDEHGEPERDQNAIALVVHEIVHGLGFGAHPDSTQSVMSYDTPYAKRMGHFLYRLDRDMLLAAYSRLDDFTPKGDMATELGPWSEYSRHLMGEIEMTEGEGVAFGVSRSNGFVAPWAQGLTPETFLADNHEIVGSASWAGRLLGLTPKAQAVAGAADLTIQLESLTGDIDFTDLESWTAHAAPGAIGTGTMWGDGDLAYTVEVSGNTFVETGGDEGFVTGAFFGAEHEAMGGTLERTDLSAGFGGTR